MSKNIDRNVFCTVIEDEGSLRRHLAELEQILDMIPALITVLSPSGKLLYVNKAVLRYTGLHIDDLKSNDARMRMFHPEDVERLKDIRQSGLGQGSPFELEMRARWHGGDHRWVSIHYEPLRDEDGQILRWYATGTDIHDRKQTEERMKQENVFLRDEIDRTSLFEEIIGKSDALRAVLQELNKVARTDSTVLITGETGTGKELIARAIHKRSMRSGRAFISVNCAAMSPGLITSELFGHERGAFTGALQQRKGRFELADGGTLFLDEVGEMPPDAQAALLRALQEREFERVGGSRPIKVDVRVIAATNRNLQVEVSENSFRTDLFYRLNVFPLEMPPLRHRPEDIPLLVDYFVNHFAKRAAKKIERISQRTLNALQAYPWPGNVRELQNVIERAVIVTETDTLTVDERWLVDQPCVRQKFGRRLDDDLTAHERTMIEAALAESRGRVAGATGAAARLGIPRSTLESRIRALKVDKHRFKMDCA
mgnify:FL=1|tara:strand:- start:5958 stop:7409 length:1452 start_codon:yes stop_codon:yes gene_type:complete